LVTICIKIGTLGVHVSAQRNSMVALKKFHSQLLSKHLYFEVTIQPAASYLVNCLFYGWNTVNQNIFSYENN
jgi:hypothetical protein